MDSETMGRLSMGGGGGGGVGKRTVVDGKEGGGIADGGVDGVVDGRERGYVPPVVEGRSCCSRDWTMQQGHCSEAAGMCGKDPVRAGASGRPVHDVAAPPSMESVVPSLLRASQLYPQLDPYLASTIWPDGGPWSKQPDLRNARPPGADTEHIARVPLGHGCGQQCTQQAVVVPSGGAQQWSR
ncbi:hypothetical protein BGZ61DRAFT_514974 [Ilyonectria robusta]|uniref:uncharacterized protein n=1 Tax=Ilyonectria robusta TaxID=1079257 RepID=UPI001E8D5DF1|nr:uncharacterized protein BGZ61DRAFT_514974 [Ilyonectria robusta]KAH8733718.1 hypothetical protein BGZ61DRAFT_514974 [Ilyonectria robusta]